MKKTSDFDSCLIRHDYKRAVYRAMLSELPPGEIIEFFHFAPLIVDGEQVQGKRLFDLLWAEKGKITCEFDYRLDNHLERFLISKNRDTASILKKVLWLNNNSTHIPGKILLTWFYPKLESIFDSVDTRDMVFSMITIFTEKWLPNHIHRRVMRREEGDWVHSIMMYHVDPFMPCVLDWDLELIAGPQIINSPLMFALPPFEDYEVVSEYRRPETVVWVPEDRPVARDGLWFIQDEEYGREESFSKFCGEKEIDLSRFGLEDRMVMVCGRDYFCPIRKRVVLHAGAAYGAPTCMSSVRHRKLKDTRKGGMGVFIQDMVQEELISDSDLDGKHEALIALLSKDPRFEYHVADESLSLNGRHFTKGVPAKILKYLFEAHLHEAKSDFEYRELKRIFEITQGQKNSNFEVRFYRLVEKLNDECPAIRIEKTGRGRFSLRVTGGLQYRETTPAGEVAGAGR